MCIVFCSLNRMCFVHKWMLTREGQKKSPCMNRDVYLVLYFISFFLTLKFFTALWFLNAFKTLWDQLRDLKWKMMNTLCFVLNIFFCTMTCICCSPPVDVDECAAGIAVCPRFRKCINTFGSYICKCHEGFDLQYINGKYQCIGTVRRSPQWGFHRSNTQRSWMCGQWWWFMTKVFSVRQLLFFTPCKDIKPICLLMHQ